MSNLYVISGPSGVGKDTLVAFVFERIPNLVSSVSVTSRKPRQGEVEGREYFFKSKDDINKMISDGRLIEWNEYAGNIYGTPKDFIEKKIKENISVLLSIDVNGAFNIKKNYPNAKLIFIKPPNIEELKKRLIGRGTENLDQINDRLNIVKDELEMSKNFDYVVVNDKIDKAVDNIVNYINKSC